MARNLPADPLAFEIRSMSGLEHISEWLRIITYFVASLAAGLWGCRYALHGFAGWDGPKSQWLKSLDGPLLEFGAFRYPDPTFWSRFPRRYSRTISIILIAASIWCIGFGAVRLWNMMTGRSEVMAIVEKAEEAVQLHVDAFVLNHSIATARNKREWWCDKLIAGGDRSAEFIVDILPFVEDDACANDILYCLQELRGYELGIKIGESVSADEVVTVLERIADEAPTDEQGTN